MKKVLLFSFLVLIGCSKGFDASVENAGVELLPSSVTSEALCTAKNVQNAPISCGAGYAGGTKVNFTITTCPNGEQGRPEISASAFNVNECQLCPPPSSANFTPTCSSNQMAVQNSGVRTITYSCATGAAVGTTTVSFAGTCLPVQPGVTCVPSTMNNTPVACGPGYNGGTKLNMTITTCPNGAQGAPVISVSNFDTSGCVACPPPNSMAFTPTCSSGEVAVQNSGVRLTTYNCDSGAAVSSQMVTNPGTCQKVATLCTPNSMRTCNVTNGQGAQTCSVDGSQWGLCLATSCNPEFTPSGTICVSNIDFVKAAGSYLSNCWRDGKIICSNNSGPSVLIGVPNKSSGNSSSNFNFPISYGGATQISLSASDVSLSGSGSSGCSKTVSGSGTQTRTVMVSNCRGQGEIMISLASGTAMDANGVRAQAVGPSTAAIVSNAPAPLSITPTTGEYSGRMGNQKYDLYVPANWSSRQNWPALIWVHGGGWTGGDRTVDASTLVAVANLGVVVVSIDYTKAPGYDYRDDYYGVHQYATSAYTIGMEDVQSAVTAFFANVSAFRVDASKVSISGSSAGGHLILYQATSAQNVSQFNCVISISGPTNLTRKWVNYPVSNYIIGKVMGTNISELQARSPALRAYGLKANRTLIVHGVEDNLVPIDQAMDFVAWLKVYQPTHDLTVNYQSDANPSPVMNPKPEEVNHAPGDYLSSLLGYFQARCL